MAVVAVAVPTPRPGLNVSLTSCMVYTLVTVCLNTFYVRQLHDRPPQVTLGVCICLLINTALRNPCPYSWDTLSPRREDLYRANKKFKHVYSIHVYNESVHAISITVDRSVPVPLPIPCSLWFPLPYGWYSL